MEESNDKELQDLIVRFTNEVDKTVQLLQALRERAIELAHKGENILVPEIKQNVRKKAITELKELTEKLVSINIDLELDYVDSPNLVIPYHTPGDGTVHNLKFLSGDNPWCFWLLDSTVDTKGVLKSLLYKFQNNLLDRVKNPKAAQSVCFIDRNKVIRGIVLQIINENRIKLVDCDSNVTKVVTSDKLYKVDLDACSTHASALRCTITEEPDSIELWKNSELRDIFCNSLREATLNVKIVKRVPGPFPMFVVDIELQNEEEECTADLREWILCRLMPELKKLDSTDNESICDYLSEESLSPYYKGVNQKVMNVEKSQFSGNIEISSCEKNDKQTEELNNLNYSSDKLSDKVVTSLNVSKEENSNQDIVNYFENRNNKETETTDKGIISSSSGDDLLTSSSKESLVSDPSHQIESPSKLNCHSKEFRPKAKKPNIPRLNQHYQNQETPPPYNQPLPPVVGVPPMFVPPQVHPWPYVGQPVRVVNGWSMVPAATQPTSWAPGPGSAFSPVRAPEPNVGHRAKEVNAMAPEFVPRSTSVPLQEKVELPSEPIILRKSTTLINENENLLVMISHVESPSEFYIHFVNQSNKYMDKLLEDMFAYYTTREKINFDSWREAKTKLGKYCACKWPRDNHWYRVEVLDWAVGDNQVKVCFVDHGNVECLPLTCLQPLIKKFEKLSICAQTCHLAKIHPAVKGQFWSEEAIDFFKSKVEVNDSRVYSITVVQSGSKPVKPNSFSVLLYEGKATDGSKSINELMVEQGLAWSRTLLSEPASSASSEVYHSLDDLSDKKKVNISPTPDNLPGLTTNAGDGLGENLTPLGTNPLLQNPSDLNNGPELDDDFEHWDPLKEDYESNRNNPALDTDDACVAVSGYSARDEARICKFYAKAGFCFKTVCYKEHSMPNPDGITTDKEEVYVGAFSLLELPKPGEVVRLKITCVFNINLFYAQLDEKRAIAADDDFSEEAETFSSLHEFMNRPENVSRMRGLTVAPSPGELVLAKEDDCWYRARVITSPDDFLDNERPEVMFVDFGSTATVRTRDLRKMEKRYLHLPFQAIECSLANVTPIDSDSENMKMGAEVLQDLLLGQILTARVYESEDVTDDVVRLQVLLQLDEGTDVGDILVERNICYPRLVDNSMNGESFQQMEVILESSEYGDIGDLLIENGCAAEKELKWLKTASLGQVYFPG